MEQQGVPAEAVWRYREDVWRLASPLRRRRQDAEDVTHSALLKAAEHVDGFRWEASLRTWLHRIATNECRMLRRARSPCPWTSYWRRRRQLPAAQLRAVAPDCVTMCPICLVNLRKTADGTLRVRDISEYLPEGGCC